MGIVGKDVGRMWRQVAQTAARKFFECRDQRGRSKGVSCIGVSLVLEAPRNVVHQESGNFRNGTVEYSEGDQTYVKGRFRNIQRRREYWISNE